MAPFGSCRLFTLWELFLQHHINTDKPLSPFPTFIPPTWVFLIFLSIQPNHLSPWIFFPLLIPYKTTFSVHNLLSIVSLFWFKTYFIGSCFHTRIKHDKKASQVMKTKEIHKKVYFQKNLMFKDWSNNISLSFQEKGLCGESWLLL